MVKKELNLGNNSTDMSRLFKLLESGEANVKLEISGSDLLLFSNDLINKAKEELASKLIEVREEKYLAKEEVKSIFEVCDATLWHWNKKGYLKVIKIGNKVKYLQSDIDRILQKKEL